MCRRRSRRSRLRPGPGRRSGRPAQATPPFGLTLRAMHGMRLPARAAARPLSACQCWLCWHWPVFPVLAQARLRRVRRIPADGNGCRRRLERWIQRRQPGTNRRRRSRTPRAARPRQTTPAAVGGGGNNAVSGSGEGNPNSNSQARGRPDGGSGSGQQGSPANATSGQKNGGAQQRAQAENASPPPSDDGGSSPLVPILIAIAVLAAISIGVGADPPAAPAATAGELGRARPKAS